MLERSERFAIYGYLSPHVCHCLRQTLNLKTLHFFRCRCAKVENKSYSLSDIQS